MSTTPGNDRWEIVPASTIYQIFEETVILPKFQIVKNGVLARQVSVDLIHVVKLAAFKGAAYGFHWGVSLTYIPHRWEEELRWHRSMKSATLDLWDQLADLPQAPNHTQVSIPSSLHGPEAFEHSLRREWQDLKGTITSWLERVSDLSGVLAMSKEQTQRYWKGPRHWPPPGLAHAFTLARMGDFAKATAELKVIADGEASDPNNLLFKALERVSSQVSSDR